ncbi:hypothetical protein B0A53_04367 [Rhodotorula sp. CCFEE 5036]|nr:hypothetical protein B0A53_04367 [Rhodotorula sp. CCFEE 5036]
MLRAARPLRVSLAQARPAPPAVLRRVRIRAASVSPWQLAWNDAKAGQRATTLARFYSTSTPQDPPRVAPAPHAAAATNAGTDSPVASSFTRKPRLASRHRLSQLQHDLYLLLSRKLPLQAIRSRYDKHRPSRRQRRLLLLALALAAFATAYEFSTPFRHGVIAVERCAVIGWAVLRAVVDYKLLFRKEWPETAEGHAQRHQDYEDTHWKAAHRLMEALRQLGGIYIKLGQHLSTVQLIPAPWAEAMRPLQDQCFPTPLDELQALFLAETGAPMTYFFSSFDPDPIGVASLAQVHKAVERESGRMVAVKCMHPHLEEFAAIDMQTTTFLLHAVKRIFPTFEFTWLGEEMEQNLPLEMDFRHEAANAARCVRDFADLKQTTLVLPEVMWAKKRVMVMEFIQGGRVDDLAYLAKHKIDRNLVSREIAEITARMIHITGFFHADLHGGNLLIRPALPHSRSPYNFEVVLLDHGLYFDLPDDLRVNYSKFWLSLMESNSPSVEAARRKYAKLVANIDDDHYPLFQAAITGRAALQGATLSGEETKGTIRRGSMLDLEGNSPEERKMMRRAMVEGGPDGSNLLEQLFVILRNIPRRMLMIFKVNDLNRALDISLQTTHSPVRIFLIIASYCNLAIRLDDLSHLSELTLRERFSSWWRYQSWRLTLWMYTFGAESKTVIDRWKGVRRKELVLELIPPYVHYVFGLSPPSPKNEFNFIHYLCLTSALVELKPQIVYFHYRFEPTSWYWSRFKLEVERSETTRLEMVQERDVTEVFGNPVEHYAHKADVLRLEALQKYGGVYLDADVLVVRDFAPLYRLDTVMGMESQPNLDPALPPSGLCNAVILAKPYSSFITRWIDSYRTFNKTLWAKHSVTTPWDLARAYPTEITVLNKFAFFWPIWDDDSLRVIHRDDRYSFHRAPALAPTWDTPFACHLWESTAYQRYLSPYDPDRIHNRGKKQGAEREEDGASDENSFSREARRFVSDEFRAAWRAAKALGLVDH